MATSSFQHRQMHPLAGLNWNASAVPEVARVPHGRPVHQAFSGYGLYNVRPFSENPAWLDALPERIVLSDDLLWIVENRYGISSKARGQRFPADFASKGGIHGNRPHRGKAAKYSDGAGTWYYRQAFTQSGDPYILWGDEGEVAYGNLPKDQRDTMARLPAAVQNNNDPTVAELNGALTINLGNTFGSGSTSSANPNTVPAIASSSKTKQASSIASSSKTKPVSSIAASKDDADDEDPMPTSKAGKAQRKRRATGRASAPKRRKQAHLLVRDLVDDEAVEDGVLIKGSASNQEESEESEKSDSDEDASSAQVSRKVMFGRGMKSTGTGKATGKSTNVGSIKALKPEKDEDSEGKTTGKATGKSTKVGFNKALKPEKDEDSDGLLTDTQLSKLRYHGPLPSEELKDAEALLGFARKSDNQVFGLFQRIGTILTDFDGCTMPAAGKAATDELIEAYRTCRDQRAEMKTTLTNKRPDLVKLVTQHTGPTARDVERNSLNACYAAVREKRFRPDTSTGHDASKGY